MQSPYFSNINQAQADYSPLAQAGANIGRMYADMGANIGRNLGQAIGAAGSKYFNNKKTERAFAQYIKTQEGGNYLLSHGYSPFDIEEMRASPEKIDKEAMKVVKDIGIDKIRNTFQQQEATRMAEEKHRQATDLYNLTLQEKQMAVEDAKEQRAISQQTNLYLAHLGSDSGDGRQMRDTLNPSAGFLQPDENGVIDPIRLQAVQKVNKSMNLGRYSPAMVSAIQESFRKKDEGGSGKLLKAVNFKSQADFEEQFSEFVRKNPSIPKEQITAAREQLQKLVAPTGKISEVIKKAVEDSQFGAFIETAKTQAGTMGRFSTLLDETLTTTIGKDGGEYLKIKNPVAASVVLMQLARMAQGVGVLSNQDVNLIRGDQRTTESIRRFMEKYIGESVDLTQEMIDADDRWSKAINPQTGKVFEVGDPVNLGGANLSARDLMMFKDIAKVMDDKHQEMLTKIIPQIYDVVRGNFGGLTTNEIHEFSDLDMFYPDNTGNETVPLDGVDEDKVMSLFDARLNGQSKESLKKYIQSQESYTEADEPELNMMLDKAEAMYEKHQSNDARDSRYNLPSYRNATEGNFDSSTTTDSDSYGDGTKDLLQLGGAATTAALVKKGSDNLARGNMIESKGMSSKSYSESIREIDKGKMSDVKNAGNRLGVNRSDFKSDKAYRNAVKKQFKTEVKGKVGEYLAKRGIAKKVISKVVTGTIGGGLVGTAVGTIGALYDVYDLIQGTKELKIADLRQKQAKYKKGSENYKILEELIRETDDPFGVGAYAETVRDSMDMDFTKPKF